MSPSVEEELDALLALRAELVAPPQGAPKTLGVPEATSESEALLSLRQDLVDPPSDVPTQSRRVAVIWLAAAAGVLLMIFGGLWWSKHPLPAQAITADAWWLESPDGERQQPPFTDGQQLVAVLDVASPTAHHVYLLHQSGDSGKVLYEGPLPPASPDGHHRIKASPMTFTADNTPAEETLAMVTSPTPLPYPLQTLVKTRSVKHVEGLSIYRMKFTVKAKP
ncbi:MAG: hypothetical protein ACE366_21215 [Bradymonadia bacterium]